MNASSHETALVKQLARALFGALVSIGFGAFWLGIILADILVLAFGVVGVAFGILGVIGSFRTLARMKKRRNKNNTNSR